MDYVLFLFYEVSLRTLNLSGFGRYLKGFYYKQNNQLAFEFEFKVFLCLKTQILQRWRLILFWSQVSELVVHTHHFEVHHADSSIVFP